ncbi:cytochrome b/b6 domain-containing protein [Aquibium microcysteis]|uniref:cytochrome b/b6 domain-containing protein n=1 Tax=Aquibium microcysteis TaxID=675281 RepID=UPI00165D29FB|nr:cytochrome b/b6 domain-containing protein [Aquibium microcysteis]
MSIGIARSGRAGVREVAVWDPLVRLIHWSVAVAVLVNSFADGEEAFHHWVGYVASSLVALRLVWAVVGPRAARFAAFPPDPAAALRHAGGMIRGRFGIHLSHNPLGALMVYNIWATIAVLAATGYLMGTMRYFGVEWVEEGHELAYDWLLVSVALHVGGVLLDGWRTKVPLVRAMITGRKRIPDGAEVE